MNYLMCLMAKLTQYTMSSMKKAIRDALKIEGKCNSLNSGSL